MIEVLSYLVDEHKLAEAMTGFPFWLLLIIIVASILVLSKGADWMVDGVVSLAERTGLPKIVIGATIVSLGTTMPETFVSVMAAMSGDPGLALGNGVGSIIADTGLIFGLSVIIAPIPINRYILHRAGWWQVGAATLLVAISVGAFFLLPNPVLGRGVGITLLLLLGVYLYMSYRWATDGQSPDHSVEDLHQASPRSVPISLLLIGVGIGFVILGAKLLIPSVSEFAIRVGVPNDVVAATMVAFGTSLPELITAITAIRKGHPEITLGNVIGADVLNCLFVIGAAATAVPLAIPTNFYLFHFPAMLIILWSMRVFVSINHSATHFKRWQGVVLLSIYVIYVILQYSVQ